MPKKNISSKKVVPTKAVSKSKKVVERANPVVEHSASTRGAYYVVLALVIMFGAYLFFTPKTPANDKSITEQTGFVTYQGVEGKTALELLKEKNKVETKAFSFGEQVIAINGVTQPEGKFWAFYVNGKQATVGADSYVTKNGDSIYWILETIQY